MTLTTALLHRAELAIDARLRIDARTSLGVSERAAALLHCAMSDGRIRRSNPARGGSTIGEAMRASAMRHETRCHTVRREMRCNAMSSELRGAMRCEMRCGSMAKEVRRAAAHPYPAPVKSWHAARMKAAATAARMKAAATRMKAASTAAHAETASAAARLKAASAAAHVEASARPGGCIARRGDDYGRAGQQRESERAVSELAVHVTRLPTTPCMRHQSAGTLIRNRNRRAIGPVSNIAR